jgi:hypothetical protein
MLWTGSNLPGRGGERGVSGDSTKLLVTTPSSAGLPSTRPRPGYRLDGMGPGSRDDHPHDPDPTVQEDQSAVRTGCRPHCRRPPPEPTVFEGLGASSRNPAGPSSPWTALDRLSSGPILLSRPGVTPGDARRSPFPRQLRQPLLPMLRVVPPRLLTVAFLAPRLAARPFAPVDRELPRLLQIPASGANPPNLNRYRQETHLLHQRDRKRREGWRLRRGHGFAVKKTPSFWETGRLGRTAAR